MTTTTSSEDKEKNANIVH